jgi:nitrous oxidase accessory protein NosD
VSYTLRGRIESRLAAALVALAAACVVAAALRDWWPLELAAAMIVVGIALDAAVYHPLLPYQPGWAAVALGALELGLVFVLVRALRIDAPLGGALALFAGTWLAAQVLGHALLPLLRLSYAEDGGELGRAGTGTAVVVASVLAGAGGLAWATQPPTVHLRAGVHRGPLVITRSERLVGEPGAIVRGGIAVRASDVTIRDVTVVGGENGIEIDGVQRVVLRNVRVSGAALDGIHVRRAAVTIDGCEIDSLGNPYAQGIDISYAFDKQMSMVRDCTVVGGQEGIVTHFAMADLMDNRVSRTTMRGISMTEMSMGAVERNEVRDALGVGIYCNDHSMCEIRHNVVAGTRVDPSGDLARRGFGILAYYSSQAELSGNHLVDSPGGAAALADSRITR